MKLRTDIPLMTESDLQEWIHEVIANTNYQDVRLMRDYLTIAIESYDYEVLFSKINKMCDKCDITYPEAVVICSRCGNQKLRSFKIYNNLDELKKNWGVWSTLSK